MSTTISNVCSSQVALGGSLVLSQDFKDRCDSLVGAAVTPANPTLTDQARNAVQTVSPEQVIANGTQATRVTIGQLNALQASIDARLNFLFASLTPTRTTLLAATSLAGATGGAASADAGTVGPIGLWFNNSYIVGNVDSDFNQIGYDFGNWAFTLGGDYKVLENLAVGAAFSYQMNSASFNQSLGSTDTDVFTGSIYASYQPIENLHIDGTASYGGSNYDASRNISYVISGNDLTSGDVVNTRATSSTGGYHYSFSARAGYDIPIDALTVQPYARFNYYALTVDPYSEKGGDGWGLKVGQQGVRSLITSLGTQVSYSFSLPWGVLIPQVYGEWLHQFKDNQRGFSASFIGDPSSQIFTITGQGPTRNFGNVGIRVVGSFAHGLSGYLSYDALVGYTNINSNRVMLGGRWEF